MPTSISSSNKVPEIRYSANQRELNGRTCEISDKNLNPTSILDGIDSEEILLTKGAQCEVLFDLCAQNERRFSYNSSFDFSFIDRFDFAIAQSLLTHLTTPDIFLLFESRLRDQKHQQVLFHFFRGGMRTAIRKALSRETETGSKSSYSRRNRWVY